MGSEIKTSIRGRLVCGTVDLNETGILSKVLTEITTTLRDPTNWHNLAIQQVCYFATPGSRLPKQAGWYVICDGNRTPLHVGKSKNLNNRLNSPNGSRDNFLNSQRKLDPVRNFIKAFVANGTIPTLQVGIVPDEKILSALGLPGPLSELDLLNIEKVFDLFRSRILMETRLVESTQL